MQIMLGWASCIGRERVTETERERVRERERTVNGNGSRGQQTRVVPAMMHTSGGWAVHGRANEIEESNLQGSGFRVWGISLGLGFTSASDVLLYQCVHVCTSSRVSSLGFGV
jgi:hypothetical protein